MGGTRCFEEGILLITGLKGSSRNYGKFSSRCCKSCTKEFVPYHPRQKYCSGECQKIVADKNTSNWRKQNPEKIKAYSRKSLYGISTEEYDILLTKQGHKCGVCKQEKKLYVDHCHDSLKVRGLLCNNCNTGIGLLKENVEIMENAISYIKEYA